MKHIVNRYKLLCNEQQYIWGLLSGISLLIFSFIIANFAGAYATQMAGSSVNDLILNYLPIRDVTFIHIYAALLFWLGFIIYIVTRPELIPFVTKTAALFILVRSLFICLTHLGAPANELIIPDNLTALLLFSGDLFFSGHVGGPFLLMLFFWENKKLRYFCFFSSIFFAYIVLAGHIHYSIDVFAAPFITYGVYSLSRVIFSRDFQYIN